MNDTKVCFITCVNNDHEYSESLKYINSLYIPDGFTVETIGVKDASSMTEGYQAAMMQSDAKYKVYLHQDIFIINKNFIKDIITLFSNNARLGLLGVVGAEKMSVNGIWWESPRLYGKFYDSHTGKMERFSFNEAESDYMAVQTIDGLIMVTQYDINWRTDLFNGWHFYDASQSAEFIRAGYEVGVPKQQEPWVIHDSDIASLAGFDEAKAIYLDEYARDIFPLVSVLIPAYNRRNYLELALQSVLAQTYKNIEIIISDDSTNNEVQEMLKPYLQNYKHIHYIKNEPSLGRENFIQCFKLSNGEYINFLMDDDLFHPRKIERMIHYYMSDSSITLVTSYRELIDESGHFLPPQDFNTKIFDKDTIVDGKELGNLVLSTMTNLIGEPTTVLFRKKDIQFYGTYKDTDHEYDAIIDVAVWIELLGKGKGVYISEPLSYFRRHDDQVQGNPLYYYFHISNWYNIFQDARRDGFLSNPKDYKNALAKYIISCIYVINFYNSVDKSHVIVENKLENYIVQALKDLISLPNK